MMTDSAIELLLWGAALLVVLIIAVAVLRIVRKTTIEDSVNPVDVLTNFREMRKQGDISDAEFRTIKSVLGANLQRDANDSDQKG